jgi:hypothetical protein
MFDVVIFPEAYRRYASTLRGDSGQGLCFEGKVQLDYGAPTLIVDKVEPLSKALKLSRQSRYNEQITETKLESPALPVESEHVHQMAS